MRLACGNTRVKIDQFVEQIERRAPFRAPAFRDDRATAAVEFQNAFAGQDGFDDQHAVVLEQPRDFVPDGSQRPVLDLHQLIRR